MKRLVLVLALCLPFYAKAEGVPHELEEIARVCAEACQAECSAECTVDIGTREIINLANRAAATGIERAAFWLYDFCPGADVDTFLEQVNIALASQEAPVYRWCKETKKGIRCKSKRRFVPVNPQP